VVFESRVVLRGETFTETGTIDYSGYGKLAFETVGDGHLEPSPIAALQWGHGQVERFLVPRGISPRILPCPPRATSWTTTTSEMSLP
jgi:hypothetical protein